MSRRKIIGTVRETVGPCSVNNEALWLWPASGRGSKKLEIRWPAGMPLIVRRRVTVAVTGYKQYEVLAPDGKLYRVSVHDMRNNTRPVEA